MLSRHSNALTAPYCNVALPERVLHPCKVLTTRYNTNAIVKMANGVGAYLLLHGVVGCLVARHFEEIERLCVCERSGECVRRQAFEKTSSLASLYR